MIAQLSCILQIIIRQLFRAAFESEMFLIEKILEMRKVKLLQEKETEEKSYSNLDRRSPTL